MANSISPGGNGSAGKGLIDVCPVGEGCSLFIPNPQHPPPDDESHLAIMEVLRKWMVAHPIRVRETLPITHHGTTVALFVWWDHGSDPHYSV
jgi:hypothetical protein